MKIKILSLAISAVLLTGCGGSDKKSTPTLVQSVFEIQPVMTVTGKEDSPSAVVINANKVPDGAEAIVLELVDQPTLGEISGVYPNLSYVPVADQFGDDTFSFKLKKGTKESSTVKVNITLAAVNDAPVITGTPAAAVQANETYHFAAAASDIDSEQLSFSIDNKPDWATFDTVTGVLSGMPSNQHAGTTSGIVIRVSDGELEAALPAFNVDVIAQSIFEVEPEITVNGTEDNPLTIGISANQVPDGDEAVVVELLNQPTLGQVTGVYPALTYSPAINQFGDDTFSFKLKKGSKESSTVKVNITLAAVNDAPVITGTPAAAVQANETYHFAAAASDIDSEQLSFSIDNKPDWATFDTVTGVLSGMPSNQHAGKTSGIVIRVSDGEFEAALPAFDIEVIAVSWVKLGDLPGFEGSHLSVQSTGDDLYAVTHNFAIASAMLCASAEPSAPRLSYWDIAQNNWQELSSPQSSRYYYQAELVDKKLYLFGGTEACSSGANAQANMEVYDTQEKTWLTFAAPTFAPFSNPLQASCSFNGEVIAFSKNGQQQRLNRLNTVDNSWQATELPESLNEIQHCFSKGDALFVIQRQDEQLLLSQFDTTTQSVLNSELIPDFAAGVYYDTTLTGNKLYLLSAKNFVQFDFDLMQWKTLSANPFAVEVQDTTSYYLRDFKTVAYGNTLLSVGGAYTNYYGKAIYQYIPQ
ncbi:Ig-like domain-containing protein [Pseudoalteromonas tunicata]|uniref:Ig-like domain-containing protein n=1 Tax=Pseudoalteromonas tunicata TaxID=314281 RepID=UPI00273F03AF|nr:Ig-like domain-containing protein [Pseudoalteromonas tunicata]MDP4982327.1 Ig-like domain-containing protein [Pseudoalteromonas tunicata]